MAHEIPSDARLAAIVASSDAAIIGKDLTGIITSWNAAAERMFGYTAGEAIGRSITLIIPEERLGEEEFVLSRVRAGLGVENFETVRRRQDGTLLDVSLSVTPIRAPDGTVIGVAKTARDISKIKRMEREAFRLADTLIKLVNDVLDTSRIVTGKLRLDHAAFDLGQIVSEALDTQRHAVQAKRLHLHTHIEDNVRMIGDSDRLRQVVWNLVSNATKFTPPDGRINVDLRRNGAIIRLEVRDTGMGIAQEHLPLIFQRFWQADAGVSPEYGGLGLGLALARYLVELHGGSIHAETAGPGQGATFIVTFPTAAAILAQDRNLRQVRP